MRVWTFTELVTCQRNTLTLYALLLGIERGSCILGALPRNMSQTVTFSSPLKSTVKFSLVLMSTRPKPKSE